MVQAHWRVTRRSLLRTSTMAVAAVMVAALGLSACGQASAEATGYLAKTDERIVFVQWTEAEGSESGPTRLSGSATLTVIDTKAFELHPDVSSFTGTMQGSNVALALSKPLDSSTSWAGTLSGDRLTLAYTPSKGEPVTLNLRLATVDDYNAAIASEQQALSDLESGKSTDKTEAQAKADIDKWSAAVRKDLDELAADAAAVPPAVGAVTAANDRADTYKSTARRWMSKALNHKFGPTVCPAADSSSGAANSASAQAGAASAGEANVNDLGDVVNRDIIQLSRDHGLLASAQAALPNYKPKGLPTDKEIDEAISSANDTVNSSNQTANGASRAAAGKASTAQGYASQAQAACASAPKSKPSPSPTPS